MMSVVKQGSSNPMYGRENWQHPAWDHMQELKVFKHGVLNPSYKGVCVLDVATGAIEGPMLRDEFIHTYRISSRTYYGPR